MRAKRRVALVGLLLGLVLAPAGVGPQGSPPTALVAGQSATLLPDGRWLLLGGEGAQGPRAGGELLDPRTGTRRPLSAVLHSARAWHTATVLPDGSLLILGGIGPDGRVVPAAERLRLDGERVELAPAAPAARARHTATLLTDGRLLLVGGIAEDGTAWAQAELWDPGSGTEGWAPTVAGGRAGHTAALLPTGAVWISGGVDGTGAPVATDERYDAETAEFTPVTTPPDPDPPQPDLAASIPADGTTGVPIGLTIALRFARPMRPETLTTQTVLLSGPRGLEVASVVAAEGGRLAFVQPGAALEAGALYTVALNGPVDQTGQALAYTEVRFRTAPAPDGDGGPAPPGSAGGGAGGGRGTGGDTPADGSGTSVDQPAGGEAGPTAASGPAEPGRPLLAPPGLTGLSGQLRTLTGEPVRGVTVRMERRVARTDREGRFLLAPLTPGHQELLVDGRTASGSGITYGVFEIGVLLTPGQTLVLPDTIWMPAIDTANAVPIPSPTTAEVVLTTPRIPGLEVRIPAGTVIRDHEGRVAREVSITPIPVERPPFPLPAVEVPAYFTIQPGAGYVANASGAGVRIIYPNRLGWPADTRVSFWSYDPEGVGWHVYGHGRVTPDGRQAVPEPGIGVYEFTGAMAVSGPAPPPPPGPPPGNPGGEGGDPVDLATGLFVMRKTDLALGDLLPLALTRTYRPGDIYARPFGRGGSHPFAIFVRAVTETCQEANLILPDGGRIHYVRTNPGTACAGAMLEHTETPTEFFKSRLEYQYVGGVGGRWVLTRKDGMVYTFNLVSGVLESQQDRFGNRVTLTGQFGNEATPTRITSSTGRWFALMSEPNDVPIDAFRGEPELRARIAAGSEDLGDYLALADLLRSAARDDDAVRVYEQALDLRLTKVQRATVLTELGILLAGRGERDHARTLAGEAMELVAQEPDSFDVLMVRGLSLFRIADVIWWENPPEAQRIARLALQARERAILHQSGDSEAIAVAHYAAAWLHSAWAIRRGPSHSAMASAGARPCRWRSMSSRAPEPAPSRRPRSRRTRSTPRS